MKTELWRKLREWLVCFAVALAICAIVILYEHETMEWSVARMVCDGCFVSGVILAGFGVLVWVASFGGFNAIGYGVYLLTRIFSPSRARFEERMSYLEYCQSREKKDKMPICILVTGVVFLAVSAIWLLIYNL